VSEIKQKLGQKIKQTNVDKETSRDGDAAQ
jgi:hypothetical protein